MLQNKIFEITNEKSKLEKYNLLLSSLIPLINGMGISLNIVVCNLPCNIALFVLQFLIYIFTIYLKLNLKIVLYAEISENLVNLHRNSETEFLKDEEYRMDPNTLLLTIESHYKKIIKKLEVLNK